MGNNPSRSSSSSASNPQSPASHGSSSPAAFTARREPQRRGSIQALSSTAKAPNVKATAAPPSASLENTTAAFTRSTPRTHSRSRSHTTGATILSSRPAHHDHLVPQEKDTERDYDIMGNESSKEKPHKDHHRKGKELSSPVRRPSPLPSVNSKPVDVPPPPEPQKLPGRIDPVAVPPEKYLPPPAQYSQPPRVPIPIAEEVHTPGSPIITSADLSAPSDPIEDNLLPRRTSVLSSRTEDDDESVADDFLPNEHDGRPTVPTLLEWKGKGDKVYVTGTFANWDRKFKLHTDGPSANKDVLSANIPLIPGTHHLKFIVDGDMQINDHLPTTVDFTNSLVNYIEVSPDDVDQEQAGEGDESKAGENLPAEPVEEVIPPGVHPPQVLPPPPEPKPAPTPEAATVPEAPANSEKPTPVVPSSPKRYHSSIPRFLSDLDSAEDSGRFGRANSAAGALPAPPTLPMFLSRSILNGQTPMKDDNSVLIMPNHTVLNHLATSSIRSHVLATSATIRYKRKFLTTIMYKPTSDTGE